MFLSDDIKHDSRVVTICTEMVIEEILQQRPNVKFFQRWSDNCAPQYKNKKSFYVLINLNNDTGFNFSMHFFERKHGKGPVDGLGGRIYRESDPIRNRSDIFCLPDCYKANKDVIWMTR